MTSEMRTLLIRGARLVDPSANLDRVSDLRIENGRIAAAGEIDTGQSVTVLDGSGLILAPGFVDLHCHLREPGQEYKRRSRQELKPPHAAGLRPFAACPTRSPPSTHVRSWSISSEWRESAGSSEYCRSVQSPVGVKEKSWRRWASWLKRVWSDSATMAAR